MPTTHQQFDKNTQAPEVAAAFPESIRDRTILITGVNKLGIGYTTAQAFASQSPQTIILAGRSQSKLDGCAASIRSEFSSVNFKTLLIDLASIQSVKDAAKEVMSWSEVPKIDLVINNAGIMRHGETPDFKPTPTVDGIEDQFATNHLGHYLLTNLIMPKILSSAKSSTPGSTRIINLSSSGTWVSPFRASDINWQKYARDLPENERPAFKFMQMAGMEVSLDTDIKFIPTAAYGASKTCNVLFSTGLNKRLASKGVLSFAVNPGEVKTELGRNTDDAWLADKIKKREEAGLMHWKTQSGGASTTLVAACDPELTAPGPDGSGTFFSDCQAALAPPWSVDQTASDRLWEVSKELVGESFEY